MKHIGIVGGLSPESTMEYYRLICSEFNQGIGASHFPQITIRSINLQEILDFSTKNDWDSVARVIVSAIHDLNGAGADFAAIAANTPHNAYDRISKESPLEVLSIMDATLRAVQNDGFTKVGLLGTKPTMEYGFFQRTFYKYGIETLVPSAEDRQTVDDVIWKELVKGIFLDESRNNYKGIIQNLAERGAQGVILGCTEIPLLIKPEDSPVRTYDTGAIHARAILKYAMS